MIKASTRKPFKTMGIIVTVLAGLAVYAMLPILKLAIEQSTWTRTSCTINSSSLVSDDYGSDSLNLSYSYTVNGEQLKGTRFEAPSPVSHSEVFYKQELERLVPGTNVHCFYDPAAKDQVVLNKVTVGDAAFIIIPIIFLLMGLGILFIGLKAESAKPEKDLNKRTDFHDDEIETSFSWGRIIFFSLFVLVGSALTYVLFVMPFLATREAKNWNLEKCKISDSYVSVSTSRDSKTGQTSNSYSLVVRYTYTVDGKHYLGDTYNTAGDRFLGSDKLYEISNQLTKGTEVDCFVDPVDSTRSVLNRDFTVKMYFGLFPMIFAIAGLFGMLVTSKPKNKNKPGAIGFRIQSASRIKNLLTYIFITVIWNGIVGAVVFGVIFDSSGSVSSYFPLLVISPFLLIGILLIFGLPYVFLQIFNPTLDLVLPVNEVRLGEKFAVGWKLNGGPNRVSELTVDMKPDWKHPRNSSTEPNIKIENLQDLKRLFNLELMPGFKTNNKQQILNGRHEFEIPSLEKLKEVSPMVISDWRVIVRLSIPWFPDSQEVYRIPIYQDEELEENEEEV